MAGSRGVGQGRSIDRLQRRMTPVRETRFLEMANRIFEDSGIAEQSGKERFGGNEDGRCMTKQ